MRRWWSDGAEEAPGAGPEEAEAEVGEHGAAEGVDRSEDARPGEAAAGGDEAGKPNRPRHCAEQKCTEEDRIVGRAKGVVASRQQTAADAGPKGEPGRIGES